MSRLLWPELLQFLFFSYFQVVIVNGYNRKLTVLFSEAWQPPTHLTWRQSDTSLQDDCPPEKKLNA